jgi:hypothetical protein
MEEDDFVPPMRPVGNPGAVPTYSLMSARNAPFRNFKCPRYQKCINLASHLNKIILCNKCEYKDAINEDYKFE